MRRSDGAHTSPPEFEHARYEAGEELGRGAQGVMVRVVDREAPSRDLVAKVWRGEAFRAQALLDEYSLLSRARIPGLVRAHDLARCARTGAVSLVEDFIDGPEAAAWASAAPTNARAGPLLLVLDDLHLAPAELAAAVDAYRCRGRERGVTIVATAPSAPDGAEAITIGPLDEAGFEALCTRADAARLEEAHDPTRHARGEVEMRASRASLLVPALLLLIGCGDETPTSSPSSTSSTSSTSSSAQVARQVLPEHWPLTQSVDATQVFPDGHFAQVRPPQSTSSRTAPHSRALSRIYRSSRGPEHTTGRPFRRPPGARVCSRYGECAPRPRAARAHWPRPR